MIILCKNFFGLSLISFCDVEAPDETNETNSEEELEEPECSTDCECKKGHMCIHHKCKSRSCKLDSDCHKYGLVENLFITALIFDCLINSQKYKMKIIVMLMSLTACSATTQQASVDLGVPIRSTKPNTASVGCTNIANRLTKEISANALGNLRSHLYSMVSFLLIELI